MKQTRNINIQWQMMNKEYIYEKILEVHHIPKQVVKDSISFTGVTG